MGVSVMSMLFVHSPLVAAILMFIVGALSAGLWYRLTPCCSTAAIC